MKTEAEHFKDWEAHVFGYGYGTGEPHTLQALKAFFSQIISRHGACGYDYAALENNMTPTVAWLMINTLCHADVIEYGTSPRHGWLTERGEVLKRFVVARSTDELVELCTAWDENYVHCYPDICNCGPNGYERGRVCGNPFFGHKVTE